MGRRTPACEPAGRASLPGASGARVRWRLAALAAVSIFALVVDPFAEDDSGVLDRALAAVGDGPVLHVVTRSTAGGTLVDLESGSRLRVQSSRTPGSIRLAASGRPSGSGGLCSRSTGRRLGEPIRLRAAGRAMQTFTRDYRDALRDGRARIVREGSVAGTPVYWIRVELPRPAPRGSPCGRRACQDVAISRETYLPVFVHFGPARRGFGERIVELESLPAGPVRSRERPCLRSSRGSSRSHAGGQPAVRGDCSARRSPGPGAACPASHLRGSRPVAERGFRFNGQMRRPRFEPPTHVISLVFGAAGRVLVVNQARRPTWACSGALFPRARTRSSTRRLRAPAGLRPAHRRWSPGCPAPEGPRDRDRGLEPGSGPRRAAGAQPSQVMPYFSETLA